MPTIAWTYTTLLAALQDWPVHASSRYVANLPTIIGLGERRLWGDLNIEAYDKDDSSIPTVAGVKTVAKPTDAIQVRNVGLIVAGQFMQLELRSLDYCKNFSPDPTAQALPQYYAELAFDELYLAPTPDAVYQVSYHYLGNPPESLTSTSPNSNTFLSRAGPDALLAACLAEAEQYIKADDRYQDYMQKYNTELLPRLRAELRRQIRSGDYAPLKPAATVAQ